MYVVTGASSGIGRAIAIRLASRGHSVLAVARSMDRLRELSAEFPQQIMPVDADVATRSGLDIILSKLKQNQDVSGLVCSAGSRVSPEPYLSMDTDDLVDHFRVHVASQIHLIQLLKQHGPLHRILFIDSYSAIQARHDWGAYSIIKGAAQMAARCAAKELINTATARVFPGAVMTGVVRDVLASDTRVAETFSAMQKAGRVADPDEVAGFIVAVLLDTTEKVFQSMDAWDFNNAEHRAWLTNTN